MPVKCTSDAVIQQMKQIFSEQGIPRVVRTDNGPQFASRAFQDFASEYGFKYVTASPHYPKSNGFIESQVKVVKQTLKKTSRDQSDPYLALLFIRSTPIDSKLPSPAELLQNRKFQDTLPQIHKQGDEEMLARLEYRQIQQKVCHDQHTRELPMLQPEQAVSVQHPTTHAW